MVDHNKWDLPGSTVVNPKEQCNAISLRSGTAYDGPIVENKGKKIEDQHVTSLGQEEVTEDLPKIEKQKYTEPPPKIPYPQWFRKANLDKQFSKFLDIFRKLHINIPFAEALEQMPSYLKFIKEILSRKRKLEDYETVALTEECCVILQEKLPPKLKDPARPTTVSLEMEDRSVNHPLGVIEDILVKVGKFIFPANFTILDMEEDENIPIILGRPFLATGRALIDV
ncbi:uncharacterized protein LOC133806372 [Humulus lupulus]|uniref:uncharacterized protein LOC133806372 n=1 Tax=Humulus lupulus TaxID=3486 RepID=UPI002B406150|nr:uncharacterized protein LOC133806372 [Humulus lupulus]